MFKYFFNKGENKEEDFNERIDSAIEELRHSQNTNKSNEVREHYLNNSIRYLEEARELLR